MKVYINSAKENWVVDRFIKEWNKEVRIMLEEAGLFEKNGFRYINGRQTEILLIKPFK